MISRTCKECNQTKEISCFPVSYRGEVPYHAWKCKTCKHRSSYERKKENGQYEARKEQQRRKRHDPDQRAKFILSDSIVADRAMGWDNDLTLDFVEAAIRKGCTYCEIPFGGDIRIGLDRIDNGQPHTRANVNAACTRCNFIRKTMPYPAWLLMVPAIRTAATTGLFDDWDSFGFRHHRQR